MPANWRLAIGIAAFAFWAPASLLVLPLAGLLVAARPRGAAGWFAAALAGGFAAALLTGPAADPLAAAIRAYAVLLSAAFALLARYRPGRFLPRAVAAALLAAAATAALAWGIWGSEFAAALRWDATRLAGRTGAMLVSARPELAGYVDPLVRFAAATLPATLALQTLAGLALAWEAHRRVAAHPLGEPLAPFREFRFADQWVWSLVAALAVAVVPKLAALQGAALNLGIVAGTLYLLRGAAIVIAFAQAAGISTVALVAGAAVAAVLALPLLVILPGLGTLGVTDTWFEFRRRLAGRANGQ